MVGESDSVAAVLSLHEGESIKSIDLGVTGKYWQIGRFTNTGSVNDKDKLSVCVCACVCAYII